MSFDEGAALFRHSTENPGESLLTALDEIVATAFALQRELGGSLLDANSPASFAMRIYGASDSVRWRVMNASEDPPDPISLANDVMNVARLFHALSIEFVEGNGIGKWQAMGEHQRNGGATNAARRSWQARQKHEVWQRDAMAQWAKHPERSVSHVASVLAKQYGGDSPFSASANTIRLVLRKPDGKQSTPSAPGDT